MKVRAIFFLVTLAVPLTTGCDRLFGDDAATSEPAPQAVRITAVRRGPVVEGRSFLADVAPRNTVRVVAQVPGTVSDLPVAEAEEAPARTVLARVAAPDMLARLNRVRSERQRAERERDFACSRRDTDRTLHEAGDVSPEQLRASEKNCASAELAVEAARSAEEEVAVLTARASERAPFDGVVLEHLVDVGQTVGPGTPMLLFGSTEVELVVRLGADDLADGIGVGTMAVFEGGRGRIDRVGGQLRGPGRVVDAHVTVTEGADRLPPAGGTVDLRLVTAEAPDATAVPLEALGGSGEDAFVVVVEGDKARRVRVRPGPRENGWIAVEPLDGTSLDGARVVVGQPEAVDVDEPVFAVEVDA